MNLRKRLAGVIASLLLATPTALHADDLGGVIVRLEGDQGTATIVAQSLERFKIQIAVDPQTGTKPLAIRVELPNYSIEMTP